MAKKVSVIQPFQKAAFTQLVRKLRVCAYARVSTNSRDQLNSYLTQVQYYTDKIKSNPAWEFAGVYADEGITGRKKQGREDFEAMLRDCEDGLIDLTITKSIARFARNTIECIEIVRKLKLLGVAVYFEKENINTLEESGELILTIMAAVAQAESEDFAGNNRWAVVRRFENGTFTYSSVAYGYNKDAEKNLQINEDEAKVVRWIYQSYLNGMGTYMITKELTLQGVPTIRGSKSWCENEVRNILTNPIYEGNSLLQRTYTEKTYPFAKKENKGQLAMYLWEDVHPQIVTHEEAAAVRSLMEQRQRMLNISTGKANERYTFTEKVVCEDCGKHLKRKIVSIGTSSEHISWECPTHVWDKEECRMKPVREDSIEQAFVKMWNKLYTNQGTVLEPLLKALNELRTSKADNLELEKLNNELKKLSEQSQILNQVMKKGYMDSAIFMEKNNLLMFEMQRCRKKQMQIVRTQKREKEIIRTEQIIQLVNFEGYQWSFDERLFQKTVKEVRVSIDHEIAFVLINGLVLKEKGGH